MRLDQLAGKRVAIWGMGREGRAALIAVRQHLPDQPISLIDQDLALLDSFSGQSGIAELRDGAAADCLDQIDVVIKSPGVSRYDARIERNPELTVTSGANIWFAENPNAVTLCISGTKGKSTTAALTAHLMVGLGLSVALAGNIGNPLLSFPAAQRHDLWVIELSSYQLADFDGSPTVALLLNLFPEHLDWHGGESAYRKDKLRLLTRGAMSNIVDGKALAALEHSGLLYFNSASTIHVADGWFMDGTQKLFAAEALQLSGSHNQVNACAALTAVKVLGFLPEQCGAGIASFRTLPHRLQVVSDMAGLRWVDDSISTTPQSTLAALKSFSDQPVTVLVGGHDRGLRWDVFADYLEQYPKVRVITLPDSGSAIAALLRSRMSQPLGDRLIEAGDLSQAVTLARQHTPAGGVVLLSPGAPSFGQFQDFEERGSAFLRALEK